MNDRKNILKKNDILTRRKNELIENSGYASPKSILELSDIKWKQINGMTRIWKKKDLDYSRIFVDIISSINIVGAYFGFLIVGDKSSIKFYIGTNEEQIETMGQVYKAYIPGIEISSPKEWDEISIPRENGCIVTGYPIKKEDENNNKVFQIDNICRGLQETSFAYIILAKRLPGLHATIANEILLDEMKECSENVLQTVGNIGSIGNISKQSTDYVYQDYLKNLERVKKMLDIGIATGIWSVSSFLSADNEKSLQRLKSLVKANMSGKSEDIFENLHCIRIENGCEKLFEKVSVVTDIDEECEYHPLGTIINRKINRNIDFMNKKYQTVMSSEILSLYCRFPQSEFPGFYLDDYVEFDLAQREKKSEHQLVLGNITTVGRRADDTNNLYDINLKDLSRHALVIGITGGGKTNTAKAILNELWVENNTPFLVIESAKREYWELANLKTKKLEKNDFKDLLLYTLGAEAEKTSVPYRINPFEVMNGVSIQTHIDYLLSTFQASFELYPPMPYVLERAVYEVYEDRGWDIVENRNIYGLTMFPTLSNLYYKIDIVTERLGYDKEVQSNVKAALKARINSLRIGGKGAMLDTQKSVPMESLLNHPTILELEDIGDDDTKSFVIGILMVQLYEYRKATLKGVRTDFNHLLVIEEAHRILKAVGTSSDGNNSRAKAVEFFCNMLAEIRTFGQGILIADQVPTKLAVDTIKNTNLKIVHRTVMKDDREIMGQAMNMTDEQIGYLSSLRRGCAAVYAEGDNKPKLVKMPLMEDANNTYSRQELINKVRDRVNEMDYVHKEDYHEGCLFCENPCNYHTEIKDIVQDIPVDDYLKLLEKEGINRKNINEMIIAMLSKRNLYLNKSKKICFLGEVVSKLEIAKETKVDIISKMLEIL